MNKNPTNKTLLSVLIITSIFITSTFTSCKIKEAARTEPALGTVCTINAYDDGTKRLYDELFERLNNIEKTFSVNISTSEISRINESAGVSSVEVTDDVLYVLKEAIKYAEISDGAFDPTIGPLVKLWGINTDHARVPGQNEIDNALPLVNYKNVKVEGHKVFLTEKNMSLDLGGIAKGYAADEMVKILNAHKAKQAVIDLGGNIYVYGSKKDKSPWKVGIKNPDDDEGSPALILTLDKGTSVVTSGVYERFFIKDGVRYHHILNTKTGYPAVSGNLSSTIISTSSIQADALSTISFILGVEKFSAFVKENSKSLSNIKFIFIDDNKKIFASSELEIKSNNDSFMNINHVN